MILFPLNISRNSGHRSDKLSIKVKYPLNLVIMRLHDTLGV